MRVKDLINHDGILTAEVEGDSGNIYIVVLDISGNEACDCPDFFYKKRRCKHINMVLGHDQDNQHMVITKNTVKRAARVTGMIPEGRKWNL